MKDMADLLSRTQSATDKPPPPRTDTLFESTFEDWTDMREWFDTDLLNWVNRNYPTFNLH